MVKRQRATTSIDQSSFTRAFTRIRNRPSLNVNEILNCADAYHAHHGKWPKYTSGPIPESPNDPWLKVHAALRGGLHSLEPGSSLAQLLAAHRGVRNRLNLPPLRRKEVLI